MNMKEENIEQERIKLINEAEKLLTDEQKEYLKLSSPLLKPDLFNVIIRISTEGTNYADEK